MQICKWKYFIFRLIVFLKDPLPTTLLLHFMREWIGKLPLLHHNACFWAVQFASTYVCEQAFSQMKVNKSKYRTKIMDKHLFAIMWFGISPLKSNVEKLTEKKMYAVQWKVKSKVQVALFSFLLYTYLIQQSIHTLYNRICFFQTQRISMIYCSNCISRLLHIFSFLCNNLCRIY